MTPPDRWLRRLLPLLALVVVASGSWAAASAADRDDAAVEPDPYPLTPADPVLSARRLPRTLQAPLAEAALRPRVEALVGASPADSCVAVEFDDRELVRHNSTKPLVPASNQKLLTTWAALQVLGPDARFRTRALSDAPLVSGVLEGDLWIVGDGDPLLMTDPWLAQFDQPELMVRTRLEDLADRLVAAGITRIAGAVVGDESKYDTVRIVPTWAPRLVEQFQAGPLSALMVNEGMESFPPQYVSRGSYAPSADPAVHAATQLAELLVQRGVTVGAPPRSGVAPPDAAEHAAVESPPLAQIVRGVNTWSNNSGAELLLKALDAAAGGAGTTAGGAAVVVATLTEAAMPVEGLVVNDGSGLDEGNRVSCDLLHAVLDEAGPDSVLAASLPLAGVDGTLRSRFLETAAEGRVRAKTGSLRGVTALSGYVSSASDAEAVVTFAYIANAPAPEGAVDLRVLLQQEPFVTGLAEYPDGPAITELDPRQPRPVG